MMNCIFCSIVEKKIPATILDEDELLLAFRDIRPQAPTHIQIIPKRHIPTINDVVAKDSALIGAMVLKAQQLALQESLDQTGYRLVFNVNSDGGQEVYHIHLHLLGGRQMTWPPG
jgi:histidine triad (HIT) family protein